MCICDDGFYGNGMNQVCQHVIDYSDVGDNVMRHKLCCPKSLFQCFDDDECTDRTHTCPDNAQCTNTPGQGLPNVSEVRSSVLGKILKPIKDLMIVLAKLDTNLQPIQAFK